MYYALEGIPVTTKCITVAGAVKEPSTFTVPIGISFADVISAAGGERLPSMRFSSAES